MNKVLRISFIGLTGSLQSTPLLTSLQTINWISKSTKKSKRCGRFEKAKGPNLLFLPISEISKSEEEKKGAAA
jgi:hypothetical protein